MSKDPKIKLDWRNPYPHPGTWKQFCIREDNKELTLDGRRQKFLKEESLYYKFRSPMPHNSWLGGGGAGGNSFTGNASDGPIAGATVTCNLGTVVTDALGNFTYPDTPSGEITVTGGTDAITGVAFTGELKGFPKYKTVSPLTTLAYHLKEEDNNLDVDGAIDLLFVSSSTLFGIELAPEDKDVMLNKDYVAESVTGNDQKAVAAQSIATYLESVTEMIGSSISTVDGETYQTDGAKVEAYKSIARQIRDTSGAKASINPTTLFDKVTTEQSFGALEKSIVATNINNVRNELESLARSETFSANYLTTRIQAINRGVKRDYAEEAEKVFRGQLSDFKAMDALVGASTGSLTQIEDGKANEVDKAAARKSDAQFYEMSIMTYTQTVKGDDGDDTTVTLSNPEGEDLGLGRTTFVSYTSALTLAEGQNLPDNILESVVGGYLLNSNKEPFNFTSATNYQKGVDIVAAQSSVMKQNEETNKVYQITIANPTFKITKVKLITKQVAKYLPTGTYTLESALISRKELDWGAVKGNPNFGTIGANTTTVSATVPDKPSSIVYTVEYNSSNSRYQILINAGKGNTVVGYISGTGEGNEGFDTVEGWNTDEGATTKYRIKVKAGKR
jgi:hypothetical protein